MRKRLGFVLIGLALILVLSSLARAEVLGVYKAPTGTGWLERTDQGDLVLHLAGSYYDMGYEHARLGGEQTQMALRAAKNSLRMQFPWLPFSSAVWLINKYVWEKAAPHVPAEFKEEMRGLSEASGVPLETIQAAHSITYLTSCAGAVAWGPATRDHELYFARSNDVGMTIDPKTDQAYQDWGMIVIYQPTDGIPYMMISWPGFIGASDGMNTQGIAVGNMSDPSRYETPGGVPMLFRLKQTLAKARALDEALAWMTVKPYEGGYNFLVADGKLPAAKVIEMDARTVYVGGWDGPAESSRYTYEGREYAYEPREDLLTRANHPLSLELIADHQGHIDDAKHGNRITANRYQDLRARLVKDYGRLDLTGMMEIMRAHYSAMTYNERITLGGTSHQFSLAPKSGDFLIAFSKGNPLKLGRRAVSAFSQPYHRYNLFELIRRQPE